MLLSRPVRDLRFLSTAKSSSPLSLLRKLTVASAAAAPSASAREVDDGRAVLGTGGGVTHADAVAESALCGGDDGGAGTAAATIRATP